MVVRDTTTLPAMLWALLGWNWEAVTDSGHTLHQLLPPSSVSQGPASSWPGANTTSVLRLGQRIGHAVCVVDDDDDDAADDDDDDEIAALFF